MITTTTPFRVGDVEVTVSHDDETDVVTETYEILGVLITVTSMFPESKEATYWLTDRLSMAREATGLMLAEFAAQAEGE